MSDESCSADNGDEAPSDRRSKVFPSEFSTGASRGSGEGPTGEFTAGNDIFTGASDELVLEKYEQVNVGMDHLPTT